MALRLIRAWREFVPEWNSNRQLSREDQLRLKYRTLTVEDILRAQEEVDIDLLQAQEISRHDMATQRKYWQFMRHVLSNYTSEWCGVEVDGEKVATGEQVAIAVGMASMDLLGEVVSKIIGESLGTTEEAKNFVGQFVPESSDSATTAEAVSPSNSKPHGTAVAVT